jgi:hypothetical protein
MNRAATRLKRFWHGMSITARVVLLVLVALLVIARLVMPYAIQRYVNYKLQQLPGYGGSIGEVDVHLWRGAYSIHNVNIQKKTNNVPFPFVAARRVDFSVDWNELRHRAVVGEVLLEDAHLNFVKGERKTEDQTKIDKGWVKVVQDLFPFKINRLEIRDSVVRYADLGAQPSVDISVTNLQVVCRNITNSRNTTNELPTPFEASGTTIGGGRLRVQGAANPFTKTPRFDVNAALENVDLIAFNDFLEAYAKVDVKRGRLSFFTEMAAADGKFKGYAKPLIEDLDIVDLKDDAKKPLKLIWESVVAGVMKIFKNQPRDRFAAKIPIEGDIDSPSTGIVETLASVLRNAFIRALAPTVDETIDVESVKPTPGSRPPPTRDTTKNEKSEQERVREKEEGARAK